jgi:secreted Zn-dependent insulinase-like peptidase
MDVSELRKRILRALDAARREAAARRVAKDEASTAYERFLSSVAVPLMRQAAQVLNATGESFSVQTPAGTVRLVSDKSAETFVELALDTTAAESCVVGRISLTRGRSGRLVDERPIAEGKPVSDLTEEDVSQFLVAAIPRLVIRPM